jgi:hypothetical protein
MPESAPSVYGVRIDLSSNEIFVNFDGGTVSVECGDVRPAEGTQVTLSLEPCPSFDAWENFSLAYFVSNNGFGVLDISSTPGGFYFVNAYNFDLCVAVPIAWDSSE